MERQGDSFGWELVSDISQQHTNSSQDSKSVDDKDAYWPQAVKQLSHRCAILEQEKQLLMKTLFEKQESLKHAHRLIQSNTALYREKQKAWGEANSILKVQNINLNKQISELLDVIKLSKDEVAEIQDKMAESEQELRRLKQAETQIERLEAELEDYKRQNSRLAEELKLFNIKQKNWFDKELNMSLIDNERSVTARDRYDKSSRQKKQHSSVPRQLSNEKVQRIPLKLFIDNVKIGNPMQEIQSYESKKLTEKDKRNIIDKLKSFRKDQQRNLDKNQFLWTLRNIKQ